MLGMMLYALYTFSHLMHIKPVTNCNSVKGSCYYGVAAIWEVFMEKVNFNQKIIRSKLGGEWWVAWERLLPR